MQESRSIISLVAGKEGVEAVFAVGLIKVSSESTFSVCNQLTNKWLSARATNANSTNGRTQNSLTAKCFVFKLKYY